MELKNILNEKLMGLGAKIGGVSILYPNNFPFDCGGEPVLLQNCENILIFLRYIVAVYNMSSGLLEIISIENSREEGVFNRKAKNPCSIDYRNKNTKGDAIFYDSPDSLDDSMSQDIIEYILSIK